MKYYIELSIFQLLIKMFYFIYSVEFFKIYLLALNIPLPCKENFGSHRKMTPKLV